MSDTMKAIAVLAANEVAVIDDAKMPHPGAYEALVKIHSCGFCNGTDFHIIDGSLTKAEGLGDYPTILGHEACGDIVALGSKVRYLRVGDRCIHPINRPDGKYTMTYGNMCEYALIPDHQAMLEDGYTEEQLPFNGNSLIGIGPNFAIIPNEIDPIDGGAMLSLCECFGSARDFGISEGSSVLVYGCGPMGLGSIRVMKALGAARIVAVDGVKDRLDMAVNKMGADKAIDFTKTSVEEALAGERFDFVYDAVGSVGILESGSHFLKPGGKVCGLGVVGAGKDLLNIHNVQNNVSVHIHMQPHKRFSHMPELVDMVLAGKIDPKDFYSHVLPMEEIHTAMELVKNKQCLKVIIKVAD